MTHNDGEFGVVILIVFWLYPKVKCKNKLLTMYGEFVRALDGRIGNVSVLCAANHVTFVVVRLGMKCNARPGDGFCPLSKKLENIIPTWV